MDFLLLLIIFYERNSKMSDNYLDAATLEYMEELKAKKAECSKLADIANNLKLPYVRSLSPYDNMPYVSMKDLYEFLSDEVKLKELISRIKNKSLW